MCVYIKIYIKYKYFYTCKYFSPLNNGITPTSPQLPQLLALPFPYFLPFPPQKCHGVRMGGLSGGVFLPPRGAERPKSAVLGCGGCDGVMPMVVRGARGDGTGGRLQPFPPPLQITKVTTTGREAIMTFSPTGPPPRPSPRPTPATFRTQDPAPRPWDPWSPP